MKRPTTFLPLIALVLVAAGCSAPALPLEPPPPAPPPAAPPPAPQVIATSPSDAPAPEQPPPAPADTTGGAAQPDAPPGGSASGDTPPALVHGVVRKNMATIKRCYDRGLAKDPALAGRVVARFVVQKDGSVANAADAGSDMKDKDVVACVLKELRALRFPAPEGGVPVTVTYPFQFSSGDPAAPSKPSKPSQKGDPLSPGDVR